MPDTKYIYEVKACDINNNESQSSNRVEASTNADPEPPSIPGGLKTVSKTDRTITISWDASTDNIGVKGYVVYRDRKIIGTTEGLTYEDSGLIAKTRYTYQIKAFDNMENYSDFSVPMSETTAEDVQKPTVPGKPEVTETTETSIKISWEKSDDDFLVKGYEVYRDDRIIGTTADTFYKDIKLLPDTTYIYYVRHLIRRPTIQASARQYMLLRKRMP
jgi:chitodextrinase